MRNLLLFFIAATQAFAPGVGPFCIGVTQTAACSGLLALYTGNCTLPCKIIGTNRSINIDCFTGLGRIFNDSICDIEDEPIAFNDCIEGSDSLFYTVVNGSCPDLSAGYCLTAFQDPGCQRTVIGNINGSCNDTCTTVGNIEVGVNCLTQTYSMYSPDGCSFPSQERRRAHQGILPIGSGEVGQCFSATTSVGPYGLVTMGSCPPAPPNCITYYTDATCTQEIGFWAPFYACDCVSRQFYEFVFNCSSQTLELSPPMSGCLETGINFSIPWNNCTFVEDLGYIVVGDQACPFQPQGESQLCVERFSSTDYSCTGTKTALVSSSCGSLDYNASGLFVFDVSCQLWNSVNEYVNRYFIKLFNSQNTTASTLVWVTSTLQTNSLLGHAFGECIHDPDGFDITVIRGRCPSNLTGCTNKVFIPTLSPAQSTLTTLAPICAEDSFDAALLLPGAICVNATPPSAFADFIPLWTGSIYVNCCASLLFVYSSGDCSPTTGGTTTLPSPVVHNITEGCTNAFLVHNIWISFDYQDTCNSSAVACSAPGR